MRTLAARYGISDVGLAKACARADVPVDERGYWNKRGQERQWFKFGCRRRWDNIVVGVNL